MILTSILENTTNLRRQVNIDNVEKYLYEIIDDYKRSDSDEEKSDIFKFFCSSIWSSENKRRVYTKTIRFSVRKDLLDTDIGQIFNTWSEVEYKGYKTMSKETDWISLIRQKINNIYTIYFDSGVILKRDYMNLLNTPKRLYYQWVGGVEVDPDELTLIIDNAISDAEKLRIMYQNQKMSLSWDKYKKIIEEFLLRAFDNCKLIEDCEDKSKFRCVYDFINEDNFYIRYFCKSLDGEILKWQKKYYGLERGRDKKYKRCECGALIENTGNKKKYCTRCAKKRESRNAVLRKRKQRERERHEIEKYDFS